MTIHPSTPLSTTLRESVSHLPLHHTSEQRFRTTPSEPSSTTLRESISHLPLHHSSEQQLRTHLTTPFATTQRETIPENSWYALSGQQVLRSHLTDSTKTTLRESVSTTSHPQMQGHQKQRTIPTQSTVTTLRETINSLPIHSQSDHRLRIHQTDFLPMTLRELEIPYRSTPSHSQKIVIPYQEPLRPVQRETLLGTHRLGSLGEATKQRVSMTDPVRTTQKESIPDTHPGSLSSQQHLRPHLTGATNPTLRELSSPQSILPVHSSNGFRTNLTDSARQTLKETINQPTQKFLKNENKGYLSLNQSLPSTQRETLSEIHPRSIQKDGCRVYQQDPVHETQREWENRIQGASQEKAGRVGLQDGLIETQRGTESHLLPQILSRAGPRNNSSEARITQKETIEIPYRSQISGSQQGQIAPQNLSRNTFKETALDNRHLGQITGHRGLKSYRSVYQSRKNELKEPVQIYRKPHDLGPELGPSLPHLELNQDALSGFQPLRDASYNPELDRLQINYQCFDNTHEKFIDSDMQKQLESNPYHVSIIN